MKSKINSLTKIYQIFHIRQTRTLYTDTKHLENISAGNSVTFLRAAIWTNYPHSLRLPGSHMQKRPDQPLKKAKYTINAQRHF